MKKRQKEISHSELNIEKWPVFSTYERGSKGRNREIVREREIGGQIVREKVTVRYVEGIGTLGAEEYKLFHYIVLKALQQGSKDGTVRFTMRSLIRDLTDIEQPSLRHYEQKEKSLKRCRLVPLDFENSFRTRDGKIITFKEPITLFSSLKIFERKKDLMSEQEYFDFSEVQIHPVIWQSIKERNIKPLRFDVLKMLKSNVSVLLYKHLDLVMFDKVEYQRDIVEIAEEIGITEKRVRRIKKLLMKAAKEIEGKELTHGRIRKIEVVESSSKSGYKIVIKKGKHIKAAESEQMRDEREYYLSKYTSMSEAERQEIEKYIEDEMKEYREKTGREADEFYKELCIISYFKEKEGKK